MDQHEIYEAPIHAPALWIRIILCILAELSIYYILGLTTVTNLLFLPFGIILLDFLWPFALGPLILVVYLAVASCKYIPKEVITLTDALEGIYLCSIWTQERNSQEPLAMIHHQRPALEGQASTDAKASKHERAAVLRSPNAASKVQRDPNAASLYIRPKTDLAPSSFPVPPVRAEEFSFSPAQRPRFRCSNTRNTSASPRPSLLHRSEDLCLTESVILNRAATPPPVMSPYEGTLELELELTLTKIDKSIDDCAGTESDSTLQIEPDDAEEPTDGQTSVGATNDEVVQMQPVVTATPVDSQTPSGAIDNRPRQVERETVTEPVGFAISDEQKTSSAFKLESRTIRSLTDRWGFEEEDDDESPLMLTRFGAGLAVMDPVKPEAVSELGDMLSGLSVTVQERPTLATVRLLRAVPKSKVQRVARDHVAKLGLERFQDDRVPMSRQWITEEKARRLQSSVIEQTMAMGGLEFSERANEQAEFWYAVNFQTCRATETEGDMVGLEFDVTEVPMIGSDVEAEMEVDDDTSDSDDDGGCIVEDPMQLGEDGPRVQRQARHSRFRGMQSPRERRKARLERLQDGKRHGKGAIMPRRISKKEANRGVVSGSQAVPSQSSRQHAAPVPILGTANIYASMPQGVPQHLISTNSATDLREARLGKRSEAMAALPASTLPSTLSGVGMMAQSGDVSDTTPSTTSPASTLASSTSSTPPASPFPTKEGSRKPAGTKALPRKRVLLDKPAKRTLHVAANVLKTEASRPSSASESASQSSKRLQQKRPQNAPADAEVIPLNDMADKALTEEEKTAQLFEAAWDLFDHSDDED